MKNYFSDDELKCKCGCGEKGFKNSTRNRWNLVRHEYGEPIIFSSAYRCESYNIEKGYTQTHATGQAADVEINRRKAYVLLALLIKYGFTGIGFKQHGSRRFMHADDLEALPGRPRPAIWSYS